MIRCELLVGGYAYDVTDDLVNWDDIEIKWKRQDLDGVVRSFTTKFEFCGGGYSLLVGEYLRNYLHAGASVVFYVRNNSWLWDERFRCALDFGTFAFNGTTCEINAIDDSLAALIKAKKGTQYEYSVERLKEDALLRYDRLGMNNKIEWILPEDEEGYISYKWKNTNRFYFLNMYVRSSEIANYHTVSANDSEYKEYKDTEYADVSYLFENVSSDKGYNVRLSMELKITCLNSSNFKIMLLGFREGESAIVYKEYPFAFTAFTYNVSVSIDEVIPLSSGVRLGIVMGHVSNSDSLVQFGMVIDVVKSPVATFVSRGDELLVPLVSPVKLLNRLLKSMNGGMDGLTGTISDSDSRLNGTMLLAAESVRGIENAKLYTSYNKFVEWMRSEFGFVPLVGEKSVNFVHRDTLFGGGVIKELENCRDFEYSVDSGMIYSRVNVGYEKVDYESVNGKDEFRFTHQYSTGVNLTDSSLDMRSPYRADAYGIEFLAAKRGEDTTDSKSDNDVFMVGVVKGDGVYELDRSRTVEGVMSPDTMFNVMYSQLDMIRSNERYLGSVCDVLEFASSDGNSDVVIDGEPLNGDVSAGERLFTVGVARVSTDDMDIPTDLSGKVVFSYNGRSYEGYVKEITLNIGRGEGVTYELMVGG